MNQVVTANSSGLTGLTLVTRQRKLCFNFKAKDIAFKDKISNLVAKYIL